MIKNNKSKKNGTVTFKSRLDAITELSVRNEIPYSEVMNIYFRFNKRVYKSANKDREGNKAMYYSPTLEEKVFDLTERYFDIENFKELKVLANLEGRKFNGIIFEEGMNNLENISKLI